MSRIGKLPIETPKGVEVAWNPPVLKVKGPMGELEVRVKKPAGVEMEDKVIKITRPGDDRASRSFQGLYRSLVANAVQGVSRGFEKRLEVVGVGYRAEVQGSDLMLTLGFAFPKRFPIPQGIEITVEGTQIVVKGIDKQQVGDVAARIRAHRPPEPYKGKGVRYLGEQVRRKAGKAAVGGKVGP